jgi:hypothetical protein
MLFMLNSIVSLLSIFVLSQSKAYSRGSFLKTHLHTFSAPHAIRLVSVMVKMRYTFRAYLVLRWTFNPSWQYMQVIYFLHKRDFSKAV